MCVWARVHSSFESVNIYSDRFDEKLIAVSFVNVPHAVHACIHAVVYIYIYIYIYTCVCVCVVWCSKRVVLFHEMSRATSMCKK